jgi:hypothetical protein
MSSTDKNLRHSSHHLTWVEKCTIADSFLGINKAGQPLSILHKNRKAQEKGQVSGAGKIGVVPVVTVRCLSVVSLRLQSPSHRVVACLLPKDQHPSSSKVRSQAQQDTEPLHKSIPLANRGSHGQRKAANSFLVGRKIYEAHVRPDAAARIEASDLDTVV